MDGDARAGVDVDEAGDGDGYQDTIALLQDEIARLEEELRLRDEARAAEPAPPEPAGRDDRADAEAEAAAARLADLAAELARREETIGLLLEELRLVEEAEAAGRAEWEQLSRWVDQVERRVDSRERQDQDLEQELAAQREQAETLRRAAEADRRAWDRRRAELEAEGEQLRGRLATVGGRSDGDAGAAAVAALEAENRRLRQSCEELAAQAAAGAEVEEARTQLAAARTELIAAQVQARAAQDELERCANEHRAELAALRSQLARKSLARPGEAGQADRPRPGGPDDGISVDERIRAFRQHLQEIHRREREERDNKRLSARLSRLWHRTDTPR